MSDTIVRLDPPPPLTTVAQTKRPQEIWPQLATPQRQALIRLLSELINRRLLPHAEQEATNESH